MLFPQRVPKEQSLGYHYSMQPIHTFTISPDKQMVLAALRQHLPDEPSWSAVKKLLRGRRVAIGGVLCVDEGRQLSQGEVLTVETGTRQDT